MVWDGLIQDLAETSDKIFSDLKQKNLGKLNLIPIVHKRSFNIPGQLFMLIVIRQHQKFLKF